MISLDSTDIYNYHFLLSPPFEKETYKPFAETMASTVVSILQETFQLHQK